MTVRELIEKLNQLDFELHVKIEYDGSYYDATNATVSEDNNESFVEINY
ncbi:hypothetical protein [Paenibacillus alkalitolerans]|nr:hypothetical protein [Paenibacillus alkalitolerans]